MRPKPFVPEPITPENIYFRDATTQMVWHRCALRVLYVDTDRSQVVYHANYLRYFEYGRSSLMRTAGYPYREIEDSGFLYPVISTGVDYFRSLYYDDAMYIFTRPGNRERVKLQFDYVITHADTGDLVCTGFTRHCAVNTAKIPVGIDEKTLKLWTLFPS